MQSQSTLIASPRQTREQLLNHMLTNVRGEEARTAFLHDPRIQLSFEVCCAVGARPCRCADNAQDGFDYLRSLNQRDVQIALGFMVIHEYWNIRVIEHAWLVMYEDGKEMIVDPTIPFLLVERFPTYFQGAIDNPNRPYPDLRNRQYKAAFLAAKHLAETCEYPFMETAKRRIHIGRMNWIEGLDASEGRVSR
jgi:hypothetical protein